MRTTALLTLAAASFGFASKPRQSVATFDGSQLRASVDTFYTLLPKARATDTLAWHVLSVAHAVEHGRSTWVEMYRYHGRDGSEATDSLTMDAATLLPLHEERMSSAGSARIRYDGGRVTAVITPADGEQTILDTTFAAPVFSSASEDAIARAVPRRAGYTVQFQMYYPFPAPYGVRKAWISVVGADTARLRGRQSVECWLVLEDLPSGITTFWIAKDSGDIVQFGDGDGRSGVVFRRPGAPVH